MHQGMKPDPIVESPMLDISIMNPLNSPESTSHMYKEFEMNIFSLVFVLQGWLWWSIKALKWLSGSCGGFGTLAKPADLHEI